MGSSAMYRGFRAESEVIPVCLYIIFYLTPLPCVKSDRFEMELYKNLLKDHIHLARPTMNNSLPVNVSLGLILQQIIDVDEKNQNAQLDVWLSFHWKDSSIHWDPDKNGGVKDLRFEVGQIWKPDVFLYNSVDTAFNTAYPSDLVVYHDGNVTWIPPAILTISCGMDMTWFPFDEQICYLKFGSWTYNGLKLNLIAESATGVDTSEFIDSGEWELIATPVNRSVKFYECCPDEPYPDLKFYLCLRRMTTYYTFNLIVPSSLVTVLTVFGFVLPPDVGVKVQLEVTILLASCFFLRSVADISPPTSAAIPILGVFFTCCIFNVTASVIFAVFVINLNQRAYKMTSGVRWILLKFLPRILLMEPRKSSGCAQKKKRKSSNCSNNKADSEPLLALDETDCIRRKEVSAKTDAQTTALLRIMERIQLNLEMITNRLESDDESSRVRADWKYAAVVVDRLCLILFIITIMLTFCVIFVAPYLAQSKTEKFLAGTFLH